MLPPPIKVVYVTGWGRSGSTLLDVLLGQVPGFFSAGELVYLWSRGIGAGWTCGCSAQVESCPVWSEVLSDLSPTPARELARRMEHLEQRLIRSRHLPALFAPALRRRWRNDLFEEYAGTLRSLYQALAQATGSRVIVDSSKLPAYAAVLGAIEGLDVRVVHLIRDPRAVAYSWSKGSSSPGGIERVGMGKSSLYWNLFNVGAEALHRQHGLPYLRLRYEDLVEEPKAAFARILAFAGEETAFTPFTGSHAATVAPTHTVSGNPSRFRTGVIEIAPDTRWVAGMPALQKRAVELMTLPGLVRYGYSRTPPSTGVQLRGAHA
jgi:hypothetical protein